MIFSPFAFQQQYSIPTSGLTLFLDAGNTSSYPGTGTNWFDLSGNGNNGVLTNGAVYSGVSGGAIYFDGVNDYVTFPSVKNMPTGSTNYTIIAFFNSPTVVRRNVFISWGTTNTRQYNALRTLDSIESSGTGGFLNYWWAYDFFFRTPLSNNTWYQGMATWNTSTRFGYRNNTFVLSEATPLAANVTPQSNLAIGRGSSGGFDYMLGAISVVMVYDRVISTGEREQIWNNFKGRYGY
jgi:hypothetical protein